MQLVLNCIQMLKTALCMEGTWVPSHIQRQDTGTYHGIGITGTIRILNKHITFKASILEKEYCLNNLSGWTLIMAMQQGQLYGPSIP